MIRKTPKVIISFLKVVTYAATLSTMDELMNMKETTSMIKLFVEDKRLIQIKKSQVQKS